MSHYIYTPTIDDDITLIIRTDDSDFDEQRVVLGSLEFYLYDIQNKVYIDEDNVAYSDHIYRVI